MCVWLLLGLDIGRKRCLILSWGSWSLSCSNTQLMPVGFFRQRCRFMPMFACQPGNLHPQRLVRKSRVSINDENEKSVLYMPEEKKNKKQGPPCVTSCESVIDGSPVWQVMRLTLPKITPLYGHSNPISFFFSLLPLFLAAQDHITQLGMTSTETLLFPGSCLPPLQLNP